MCRNSRIVCSYRVVATFQKGTQVKIGSIPLRLSAFARCEFPCSDHFLIHAQTSPELDKISAVTRRIDWANNVTRAKVIE
ncbi:hypothetical protein EZZ81_14830 [Pseudomonas viridiflava]|uniref:Uncharacterized protein n=1 Tax=Pseudomonas viridiflava TaxID=33069 RepID=A0AA46ZWF3_PSEVI|nr:hypothetical protein EZZ81_14830 [Pseudomonas viridiflava]